MLPGPPGSGATSLPWSQCPRYILECSSNAKAAALGFFHLQRNPYAMLRMLGAPSLVSYHLKLELKPLGKTAMETAA